MDHGFGINAFLQVRGQGVLVGFGQTSRYGEGTAFQFAGDPSTDGLGLALFFFVGVLSRTSSRTSLGSGLVAFEALGEGSGLRVSFSSLLDSFEDAFLMNEMRESSLLADFFS